MTTTDIIPFDRNAALAGPDNCELILGDGQAFDMVSSSFPGSLDPQRRRDKTFSLIREATIHIANSKAADKLCRCAGASVLDSLVSCARLDLSLTKALGHAYLVPFKNICTLMVGYKGFVKLIIETQQVRHLETVVVYDGDDFKFWRDEKGPHLEHVPCPESQGDEKKLRLVYLVAVTADGGTMFEMMNRAEIDKVRKSSQSANDGPWAYWYTEMARKSVIRRFEKVIPKGMETPADKRLADALELDNTQFDPTRLAEYKEMSDQHSRSLKERAMAPVVGENAPQGDEQPESDPTPAEPTIEAVWRSWGDVVKAEGGKPTKKDFTAYLCGIVGGDVANPRDLTPEQVASAAADIEKYHDSRPRYER